MQRIAPNKNSYRIFLTCIALLAFVAVVSLPIVQAGYYSDDIINSLVPGTIKFYHYGFWHYIAADMKVWLGNGRFFPLSVISSITVFFLFSKVVYYQIARLCFMWMGYFLFAGLIKTLTKNTASAFLFLILIPTCWSIKDVADPLVSFAIFLPLVVIFTTLSLLFLTYFQESKKSCWLALSLLMYFFDLNCYEASIVAFFMIVTMVLSSNDFPKQQWQTMKPYLIISFVFFATYFIVHNTSVSAYDGITFHISLQFFHGFIIQLLTALPLSYYFLGDDNGLHLTDVVRSMWHNKIYFYLAISLFVSLSVSLYSLIPKVHFNKKSTSLIFRFGLILLFIPAILIGLSQKYQVILHSGKGYIPVYVQYIGCACLLLSLIRSLNLSIASLFYKKVLAMSTAILISLILLFSLFCNLITVQIDNDRYYYSRALFESALQHGLLNNLPSNSHIIENLYFWNSPSFFVMNATKSIAGVIDINDTKQLPHVNNKFYLEIFRIKNTRSGFISLSSMQAMDIQNIRHVIKITRHVTVQNPTFFIYASNQKEYIAILQTMRLRFHLSEPQIQTINQLYFSSKNPWAIIPLSQPTLNLRINYNDIENIIPV